MRDPLDGQPLVYDALHQTGAYALYLESASGSIGTYQLLVERQDTFLAPADLEPNGSVATARDQVLP